MKPKNPSNDGIIYPDALYTLSALKHLLKLTDSSLRIARREGLEVQYAHKQGFVLGKNWIDHVLQNGKSSNGSPASDS